MKSGSESTDLGRLPFVTAVSDIRHVILDRDGVLNEESAHTPVSDPSELTWIPGTLKALGELRSLGVRVSVATNQAGIGRGLFTSDALAALHSKMRDDATSAQGSIDAIFYCPHAPEASCACRKPSPGLLLDAVGQSGIPLSHTLMVGDAARDLDAARAAGMRAALVRTGKGRECEAYATEHGIPVFNDLSSLVASLARGPMNDAPHAFLRSIFSEHQAVIADSVVLIPDIEAAIALLRDALINGKKVLVCGNGGSAADAQHFVAELVGRYQRQRRPLAAISLTGDTSTLTAVSNDFGFEHIFSRQVDALARPGDVLIAISTSGNSSNVLHAVRIARRIGCNVIALTGRSGDALVQTADVALRVPSDTVARVQEVHELCLHSIAQGLDSLEWIGDKP